MAIVGLGGTGSYVLDLVAKTPVASIHLFDDDVFEQHNAFRAPGAPDVAEFDEETSKVHRFAEIYSRMHSGVIPHRLRIGPKNVGLLAELDFVFLCLDDPASKRPILPKLEDITMDEWRRHFDVNVHAAMELTLLAVPKLGKGGSVTFTSSVNSKHPMPTLIPYSATKATLANMTLGLAQALAEKGIRVNAVLPGPIWTPFIPAGMDAESVKPSAANRRWPARASRRSSRRPTSCSRPTRRASRRERC